MYFLLCSAPSSAPREAEVVYENHSHDDGGADGPLRKKSMDFIIVSESDRVLKDSTNGHLPEVKMLLSVDNLAGKLAFTHAANCQHEVKSVGKGRDVIGDNAPIDSGVSLPAADDSFNSTHEPVVMVPDLPDPKQDTKEAQAGDVKREVELPCFKQVPVFNNIGTLNDLIRPPVSDTRVNLVRESVRDVSLPLIHLNGVLLADVGCRAAHNAPSINLEHPESLVFSGRLQHVDERLRSSELMSETRYHADCDDVSEEDENGGVDGAYLASKAAVTFAILQTPERRFFADGDNVDDDEGMEDNVTRAAPLTMASQCQVISTRGSIGDNSDRCLDEGVRKNGAIGLRGTLPHIPASLSSLTLSDRDWCPGSFVGSVSVSEGAEGHMNVGIIDKVVGWRLNDCGVSHLIGIRKPAVFPVDAAPDLFSSQNSLAGRKFKEKAFVAEHISRYDCDSSLLVGKSSNDTPLCFNGPTNLLHKLSPLLPLDSFGAECGKRRTLAKIISPSKPPILLKKFSIGKSCENRKPCFFSVGCCRTAADNINRLIPTTMMNSCTDFGVEECALKESQLEGSQTSQINLVSRQVHLKPIIKGNCAVLTGRSTDVNGSADTDFLSVRKSILRDRKCREDLMESGHCRDAGISKDVDGAQETLVEEATTTIHSKAAPELVVTSVNTAMKELSHNVIENGFSEGIIPLRNSCRSPEQVDCRAKHTDGGKLGIKFNEECRQNSCAQVAHGGSQETTSSKCLVSLRQPGQSYRAKSVDRSGVDSSRILKEDLQVPKPPPGVPIGRMLKAR